MKRLAFAALTFLLGWILSSSVFAQEPQQYDPDKAAEQEAERLTQLLGLEYWQTFYVDSTLRHDLGKMWAEIQDLQAQKISNTDAYLDVQDKWTEQMEASYRKWFTPEQWKRYDKSGAARARKQREKRKSK